MWAYKLSAWLRFVLAVLLAVGIFIFASVFSLSAFPQESDKEYYLYTPSSQAEIANQVSVFKLLYIKGECARVECADAQAYLQATIEKYNAEVVKVESFDGGISYYCYSPKLKNPVLLDGAFVNLHIVVKGSSILLGTPLVFGGY